MLNFYFYKNKIFKISRFSLVFVLIFAWMFSGWPQIWPLGELGTGKIQIPSEIQEVRAATTDTYYGTYDSVESDMTDSVNAETDNTQYATGGKSGDKVAIQSWSGTAGSGTISGVRIYCQHYATTSDGNDYTLVEYSLDNWSNTGTTTGNQVMPTSESSFSVDIFADRAWNWTDIGNLEVKATAKASGKSNFGTDYIDVLYIQVDYSAFSTSIVIKGQDYSTDVSNITFPAGDSSAVVSNPSNGTNTQVFGDAGIAKPVVTLYNGSGGNLIIWYNITTFTCTPSIVSAEHYLVNTKGGACADADTVSNAVTFDTDTTTGVTITNGAGNEKDFYLKVTLGSSSGKSGTSTLTILGETP